MISKALSTSWERALLFRRPLDYRQARRLLNLQVEVASGDTRAVSKGSADISVRGLTKNSWALVQSDETISISGVELFSSDRLVAKSGESAEVLFRAIGYPDRMISESNGADFIYFVGPELSLVLRVTAVERAFGGLAIYRFQIGRSSGPPYLLEGSR